MLQRVVSRAETSFDSLRRRIERRLGLTDPARIQPFRGWVEDGALRLKGRVLEDEGIRAPSPDDGWLARFETMLRRFESDEIPGARVLAEIGSLRRELQTDEEGYFELVLEDAPLEPPWTEVRLTLLEPLREDQEEPTVSGWVRVVGPRATRGVISDIDDTIVHTGATNLFRHARTVLFNDARTREPFHGVGAFYRALEAGAGGDEGNPIFYVSSSPWNLFDLFERFMELHSIPLGPIFLKDFGLDERKLFKRGHVDYKAERIGAILEANPALDFVLVGDVGQKDAWVFDAVAERFEGRVAAVYLRDLDDADPEVELAENRLRARGVSVIRVSTLAAAADHAHEQGWIDEAQRAETHRAVERT